MMGTDERYLAPGSGADAGRPSLAMQNPPDMEFNALNLLLFSVGKVLFGVDADQVARISAYKNEMDEDLFWFHEVIGYGEKTVEYHTPTIITIRTTDGPRHVIIDSMDEIAEFSPNEIGLLPALLEPFALQRGIWGVLPRDGSIILLVDFNRLLMEKRHEEIDLKLE